MKKNILANLFQYIEIFIHHNESKGHEKFVSLSLSLSICDLQAQVIEVLSLINRTGLTLNAKQDTFLNSTEFDTTYLGYEGLELLVDSIYYLSDVYIDIAELGGYQEYYLMDISFRDSCVIWVGKSYQDDNGMLVMIQKDDNIGGFIQKNGHMWHLIPNGNNKVLALKRSPLYDFSIQCAQDTIVGDPEDEEDPDPCVVPADDCQALIRIFVGVTEEAQLRLEEMYGNVVDFELFYFLGLEAEVNQAFENSDVHNKKVEITTWQPFEFIYSYFPISGLPDIYDDISTLNLSGDLSVYLYEWGCDVAIILTNQGYEGVGGIASGIGPIGDADRAILEVEYTYNTRFGFAHELGHILGGRHDRFDDNADICNHGYYIASPDEVITWTIMGVPFSAEDYILLHYSNPFVSVYGQNTGTGIDNNVAAIDNNGCFISEYQPDPYWSIGILGPDSICFTSPEDITFSAIIHEPSLANFGQPPYKYNWQYGYVWNEENFPNLNWLWATDEGDELIIPYEPDSGYLQLFVRLIVTSDDDKSIWRCKHIMVFPDGCEPDPHIPIVWKPRSDVQENLMHSPCDGYPELSNFRYGGSFIEIQLNESPDDVSIRRVTVSDVSGKLVLNDNMTSVLSNKIELPIMGLLPGIYFVAVETDCGRYINKFFKR